MGNQQIVQKLWNLCNVLRDDGITYHQYVTELTYLLFLKMMKETTNEGAIPEEYRWDSLTTLHGIELKTHYQKLLIDLGNESNEILKQIYANAKTNIDEPKNLEKIIRSIDELDWYSAKEEGLGDLYEGLLEKNASETKSGAGQYFTPRVLIDVIVKLVNPQSGERCNDPAAGTFGFMIAADHHVREQTDDYFDLGEKEAEFQKNKAFSGAELVKDTHRLALMNALLHDIHGEIILGDTLSDIGKNLKGYDVVLTNPPFGTKKGGERPTRDDLTYTSTNKQFNFLQHIYRSLKPNGKSRAAVVVPDDVLFKNESNGAAIRSDLMDKCNLHTILRLPTGIFYKPGVRTNVLFFNRGQSDTGNTKGIWFYDLRTDMPKFGKRTPLTNDHFKDFIDAYLSPDRENLKDKRLNYFTREQIALGGNNLDIGLIPTSTINETSEINPLQMAENLLENLEYATSLLNEIITELTVESSTEEKENSNQDDNNLFEITQAECPYSVPENWVWSKCEKVAKWGSGGTPSRKIPEYYTGNIPWLKTGELKDTIVTDSEEKITEEALKNSSAKLHPKGSVGIAMYGATIGKVGIFGIDAACNQACAVGRPYEVILSKYIFYYFITQRKKLISMGKGGAQPNISQGIIKEYPIPIPPLSEQNRIIEKIEDLLDKLSEVKKYIEMYDNDKENSRLDELKILILSKAFRGQLGTNVKNEKSVMNILQELNNK